MKHTFTSYAATVGVCIFLLTFVMESGYAQSPVNPSLPSTPSGTGLNTYGLLPSAQLAMDDKSRIGAGLGGIGTEGPDGFIKFIRTDLPPKLLLSLGEDYFVGREHLYTTGILLSDNVRSLDLGIQWFSGDSHGYGASIRYDPSRAQFAEALKNLYATKEGTKDRYDALSTALQKAEENAIGPVNRPGYDNNHEQQFHLRYSAILGFQHFGDDFQMANGTFAEIGATTSVLIPTDYKALHLPLENPLRHSPGVTLLASAQLVRTYPDPTSILSQATLLRYGVAVIWQDRVPAQYEKKKDHQLEEHLDRWVVQIGLEYLPKNGLDSGRSLDGFVRYRPSCTKFIEMTFNGGCDEQGVGFVNFGLATSFSIDPPHQH